jgi:hypothetical protein
MSPGATRVGRPRAAGAPAALVLAAVALSGCAGTSAAPATELAPEADCLADEVLSALNGGGTALTGRPAPAEGSVPSGFDAVRAVECRLDLTLLPPEAAPRWAPLDPDGAVDLGDALDGPTPPSADAAPEPVVVRVVEMTREGDLGPLLRALALPSAVPRPGQPCPAMAELGPELFLVDEDGRAVRVAWPRDVCGFRLRDAPLALEDVPVVAERLLERPLG